MRVEVLLPVKGPAPWLRDTLLSLQHQTFIDWQLIASMHGADPHLTSLVLEYFPEALVIVAPSLGTLSTTLNYGLRSSTAPYIARIDQDDVATPDRLARQVQFLDSNPDIAIVGTSATVINAQGEHLGVRLQHTDRISIRNRLRWKSPLLHPSVMFRRDTVIGLGGYSEDAVNVEDYDLWLRIAAVAELGGISECLIKYRVHSNQITSNRSIPKLASRQVKRSRINLAKEETRSTFAAYGRHAVWAAVQSIRRRKRKNRT
jgi:glycosyltransferase involved in cell wall biosynthesis